MEKLFIFKEREAFAKKIFNLAYEKLKEHENETMYMCDIGMALTMKENELGYFCSEKESLKNIFMSLLTSKIGITIVLER